MIKQFNKNRKAYMFIFSIFVTIFGCILLICGFIVAPLGVIDHSVIISAGEVLTFAGSVIGINTLAKRSNESIQSNKE